MHRHADSIAIDRLVTRNELAAMNRFAPFPDLGAACESRSPRGMPSVAGLTL
jgi:hypothetical protein